MSTGSIKRRGSVANFHAGRVEVDADRSGQSIQRAATPGRPDYFVRALVSPIPVVLPARRRRNAMPRVMNVDKNPANPAAMEALKAEGAVPRRVALRQCKYLNNVIEQDHRTVKKRVWLAKGYGTFQTAWRTLQGIETVHMIRKGRVRWLAKRDAVGQALFIAWLFGLTA